MALMLIDCKHHDELVPCKERNLAEAWGFGLLAAVGTSLITLVGAIFIPIKRIDKVRFYVVRSLFSLLRHLACCFSSLQMHFFLAFAVGALLGDSLLHIIPHVFEASATSPVPPISSSSQLVMHAHPNFDEEDKLQKMQVFLGPALVIIASIFALFLVRWFSLVFLSPLLVREAPDPPPQKGRRHWPRALSRPRPRLPRPFCG